MAECPCRLTLCLEVPDQHLRQPGLLTRPVFLRRPGHIGLSPVISVIPAEAGIHRVAKTISPEAD